MRLLYRSLNIPNICVLRAEILSCQRTRNGENIVLPIACLGSEFTAMLTWHSDGDVTLHVVSNLRVCGSQWVGVRLDTNWPVRVIALQSPAQAWAAARSGKQHSQKERV